MAVVANDVSAVSGAFSAAAAAFKAARGKK
jgi:hypothetical protein